MRFAVLLTTCGLLALAPAAQAATVSVEGDALRVMAGAGEVNSLSLDAADGQLTVSDGGSPDSLAAGPGCDFDDSAEEVSCAAGGVARVELDAGDGDDEVDAGIALPAQIVGGLGTDRLTYAPSLEPFAIAPGAILEGGEGDDDLSSSSGADLLRGGPGLDRLDGGDGNDALEGAEDDDSLEGGTGDDRLSGDTGDDALAAGDGNDELAGGVGNDSLGGDLGSDRLTGGDGDDFALGGDGNDRVLGDRGRDAVDGGAGDDRLEVRDRKSDSVACGPGRDRARAEVLDSLDIACERVDYGPAGRIGRLRPITGGGRFVPIPGQTWARVDRRILPDVLYLIRRYKVRVGDGYAPRGHNPRGEHPLGLAVDLTPGPGGSWRQVAKLARWAEPRQNRPRWPFSGWVGTATNRTAIRATARPRAAVRPTCTSPGTTRPGAPAGPCAPFGSGRCGDAEGVPEDPRLIRLSEICLGLPDATRELSSPHATFRVRKKTFAYYLDNHRGDEGIVGLACKAPAGENAARVAEDADRFYIPAYVGPRGWVGFRLDSGDVDWDEVEGLVIQSYLLTAPKRLGAVLTSDAGP